LPEVTVRLKYESGAVVLTQHAETHREPSLSPRNRIHCNVQPFETETNQEAN